MDILQVTWFLIERSKVNVRVRVNNNTAWVRTLYTSALMLHVRPKRVDNNFRLSIKFPVQ